ncbi:unnamed protein product [Effrenium voratum]|nr:unnamed protein product [Effrenium voratum]
MVADGNSEVLLVLREQLGHELLEQRLGRLGLAPQRKFLQQKAGVKARTKWGAESPRFRAPDDPSDPAFSPLDAQEVLSLEAAVAVATKHLSRSSQQVLFSTPMKKVMEKVDTRVKAAQRKLDRIKVAQKELKERETSIALVSDVQEKMSSVEKALQLAKEAVDASQGDEEVLRKYSFAYRRLLEVKRFTAEAGIQAQRSLQEYQQTLQGSNTQIESLKKTAVQNREVSKRKAALIKVEEAEELAQQAEASATEIFDPEKVATMSAVEIRKAGDMNQRTFKATMDAVRQAQMMITSLQIEAKNKENAAALSTEYGKLQARLRQAEAAVAHCGTLPPEVQAQLTLKAQIDEVESKVKASEEKVGQAEQLAKEAETNPIEEKPEDSKPSAAVNATAKATAAKATAKAGAWKGKAAGKGIEEPAGPVEKAKQSLEAAGLDLKICLRFLEAQSQAGKLPAEETKRRSRAGSRQLKKGWRLPPASWRRLRRSVPALPCLGMRTRRSWRLRRRWRRPQSWRRPCRSSWPPRTKGRQRQKATRRTRKQRMRR